MTDTTNAEAIKRHFEGSGYSEAELAELQRKHEGLLYTLRVSDDLMHNIILHAQDKEYELPDSPEAKVQYGLILYWIAHPPEPLKEILEAFFKEHELLKLVWEFLQSQAKPQVTEKEYEFLIQRIEDKQGVVAPEGEILGTSTYQQLDFRWLYAFFGYLLNLLPDVPLAPFGTTPYSGTLQAGADGKVRIAVIGDWGTGRYEEGSGYDPASQVMADLVALKPDYIIHLGDVYYAGTDDRPPPGEEARNLVELWPEMPPERSFTLNSNHEMYGGAWGYFDVALAKDTPFAHQKRTSYFSLRFGSWALVGLDAAYHDPSSLYMLGSLGDKDRYPAQYDFLQAATEGADKVILFSHQTATDVTGQKPLPLLDEICGVVKPAYWYWGHVHLGVVYSGQSLLGKRHIAARCIGHSAVPFGDAYRLKDCKTVEWYANTPLDPAAAAGDDKVILAKNGFALLTLTEDGITEEIYETGNPSPVWSAQG